MYRDLTRIVAALKTQVGVLCSRAKKLQDGYAIQVTSHFHQHNSNSEKRTLITGRQRFLLIFVNLNK